VAASAAVVVLPYYLHDTRELGRPTNFEMPQSVCAQVLTAGSGPIARGFMDEVLAVSKHNYLRGLALAGVARMDGPAARKRLLRSLEDVSLQSYAAVALAETYAGIADQEVSAALLALAESELESHSRAEIIQALITIGHGKDDPAILSLVERLDPAHRHPFLVTSPDAWVEHITSRLSELAIADAETAQEVRRAWLAKPPDEQHFDTIGILIDCGVVVAFDAETGMVPVRHDLLLYEFADASQGRFTPEAPSEVMVQQGPEDYDGDYTVQFIANNLLYRFGARNFGDWYDVEAVHNAVNRALADAGGPERFVTVATGDQMAMFLFGPAAVAELASELGITLGTDPNQAMTDGKEYERQVFDQIRTGT